MNQLDLQIRRAQRRLWLNRWINRFGWCLAGAGAAFAVLVLTQRLLDAPIALGVFGLVLLGAACVGSGVWCFIERESAAAAAAVLDLAAGLRERLSSSLYCRQMEDPFARAVEADAERVGTNLTVRRHLPLTMPRSLNYAAGALVVAGLMWLVPAGLLAAEEDKVLAPSPAQTQQVKTSVKKRFSEIIKQMEDNPALEDLKVDLERMKGPEAELVKPEVLRREALKKIDRLEDAVKTKREQPKYHAMRDMQRMLRGLKIPDSPKSPTQKLQQALSKMDLKTAQEELRKMQETLATLKTDQDKELVDKLSKELSEVAKQLRKLAEDKQLEQKLRQAGIKPEDVKRMLENLSKEDLDQVRKNLQKQGFSQDQINRIAKQLQQRQQAGSAARKLASAMQKASQCNNPSQQGEAMAGLSEASNQLSELEQLQSEMDQLDSAMADLDSAKNGMQPCPDCNGTGQKPGGT